MNSQPTKEQTATRRLPSQLRPLATVPLSAQDHEFVGVVKAPVASRPHRSGHAPRPVVAEILGGLAGLGFGLTLALVVINESSGTLRSPGGWYIAAGRLTGFLGSYLLLLMVFLIARIPWLERAVGQDQLVRWHRRIGGWPILLIALHITLVIVGYSALRHVSFVQQSLTFVGNYPDILASFVGFALLVMVGVSSYRRIRQRQRYENWWVLHLYTYLALALAFAHQVVTGLAFLNHPLPRYFWISIWVLGAFSVVAFRVALPILRNARYRLKLVSVHEEAPGVFSLVCSGRRLNRLAVSGGQFFQWRFLTKGLWWQAHPYSLSALPNPPHIRVTVKESGDHSRSIAKLTPGTRIFVEGPYGRFTHHARSTDSVVLIGAGVGITPLRTLLEDLPENVKLSVIVRSSTEEDLIHRREIADLVTQRGGVVHELVGSRHHVSLDVATLRRLVPEIAKSDVYICGPAAFTDHVAHAAAKGGVPMQRIHTEAFAF